MTSVTAEVSVPTRSPLLPNAPNPTPEPAPDSPPDLAASLEPVGVLAGHAGAVVGVLSGCGGGGASVLSAVLASCRAERSERTASGPVFLLDCDPAGGGIDVLLGCEELPGARWRQVRLRGGRLDPAVLLESLPRWRRVSFLAADRPGELDAVAVDRVITAAAEIGTVVLDLPRWDCAVRAAALARCDRVVLVVPAEVRAVAASAVIAAGLDTTRTVVAVRGASRQLPSRRIGEVLGLPVIGEFTFEAATQRAGGLASRKISRASKALAQSVFELAA